MSNTNITFGIEFEFDWISRNGIEYRYHISMPSRILNRGWKYQNDLTAGCEISTPVLKSIGEAITKIQSQFKQIIEASENNDDIDFHGYIPYFDCTGGRTLGQHIHLGLHNGISFSTAKLLATYVVNIYPFLMGLSANPIPSVRGLEARYCRPMYTYNSVISDDHYAEISYSEQHNTLELRIFDGNIPQVNLTNAFILTHVAKNKLNTTPTQYNLNTYKIERERALRYGLISLEIPRYISTIMEYAGNIKIPDIPCIKEILYLACKYGLNVSQVYSMLNLQPQQKYQYFKKQLTNVKQYLENILEIDGINNKERIERWRNEARDVSSFKNLLEISERTIRTIRERKNEIIREERAKRIKQLITSIPRENLLERSVVQQSITSNNYKIARISEVERWTTDEVAQYISYLIMVHGENYMSKITPRQVIDNPERFYVLTVNNQRWSRPQIIGCIAIHIREGQIMHLVVHRNYRRLGIARILVNHVINVARHENLRNVYAIIRRNNTPSITLFTSMGFIKIDENNDYITVERRV